MRLGWFETSSHGTRSCLRVPFNREPSSSFHPRRQRSRSTTAPADSIHRAPHRPAIPRFRCVAFSDPQPRRPLSSRPNFLFGRASLSGNGSLHSALWQLGSAGRLVSCLLGPRGDSKPGRGRRFRPCTPDRALLQHPSTHPSPGACGAGAAWISWAQHRGRTPAKERRGGGCWVPFGGSGEASYLPRSSTGLTTPRPPRFRTWV
jgi:hypothetical protein